jgi:hypothetical protein
MQNLPLQININIQECGGCVTIWKFWKRSFSAVSYGDNVFKTYTESNKQELSLFPEEKSLILEALNTDNPDFAIVKTESLMIENNPINYSTAALSVDNGSLLWKNFNRYTSVTNSKRNVEFIKKAIHKIHLQKHNRALYMDQINPGDKKYYLNNF